MTKHIGVCVFLEYKFVFVLKVGYPPPCAYAWSVPLGTLHQRISRQQPEA